MLKKILTRNVKGAITGIFVSDEEFVKQNLNGAQSLLA